ncbi:phosphate ABC transporter substrate-binding protein PstS [Streptomyces sp. AJS327]|uniref:phosphate ABC transporter substrate-binding protein PstS n=1 Tax=Streptomyces sp. AJS327 TaxID=2545265 RepID=UPI0015E0005B|nr:phosphate ABC transporter substrate-binding protein PstS [Streptomyces sp. AJS327]MBA0053814.1 phosphate ABC transporter substrate-binding protein PstS [Streptomyces sp. AJS327]
MKLQRTNRLRALAVGAIAVTGALVLSACGSDDNSGNPEGGGSQATGDIACAGDGKLLASGSSAQKNAVDAWVKNYQAACEGTQINYKDIGSGGGIQEWLQGTTAFAGSDSALKPDEVAASQKKVCKAGGGKGINLPMLGGPVAISYNLSGVDDLVLDAPTLAKIFDSKITTWDDAAIKKLNPDAKLPSSKIQAFHRSDESGTTQNLGAYLKAAAPQQWKYEDEKAWPAKGGQSASGSSGVAQQVKQTEGSIGYFELSYATANDLDSVKIDTGAGEPVEATTDNASKAIADAKVIGEGKDLALELNYRTEAAGAYPIILVTYEIVCDEGNKKDTLKATKSFLKYTASEDGQSALSEIGYAPLPEEIAKKVRATIPELA